MGEECVAPGLSIFGQCVLSFIEKNQKVSDEELEVISVGLSSLDQSAIVLGDAATAIEALSFEGNDVFEVQKFVDDALAAPEFAALQFATDALVLFREGGMSERNQGL